MSNSSNSNSSTVLLDPPPSLSNLPLLPGNNPKSREYIPPPPPTQSSPQPSVSQSQINTKPLKRNNNVTPKQLGKPNQNNQNNQNTQRNTRSKINPNSSPMNRFLNNPTTPSQANIPNNAPKLNNNNRPKLSRNLSKTTNNIPEPKQNNNNNLPKPKATINLPKATNNLPKQRTNNNIPKPKATNNLPKASNNIKKNNKVNNTQNNTNNEQTFNSFSVPFPKLEYKLPDRFKKIGDMNTSNTAKAGVAIGSVIVLILVFLSLILLTK